MLDIASSPFVSDDGLSAATGDSVEEGLITHLTILWETIMVW
jgi:hypothetical protein